MKSEPRNQAETSGDAAVAATDARSEYVSLDTEDSIDDQAIRDRAHQLYEETNRQDGNAEEHWHPAKRELKSQRL
jgi:hypothetical protein